MNNASLPSPAPLLPLYPLTNTAAEKKSGSNNSSVLTHSCGSGVENGWAPGFFPLKLMTFNYFFFNGRSAAPSILKQTPKMAAKKRSFGAFDVRRCHLKITFTHLALIALKIQLCCGGKSHTLIFKCHPLSVRSFILHVLIKWFSTFASGRHFCEQVK